MKKFEKYERRGLPGGPNEIASYMTGAISTQGYKSNSPDKYNDFNIIRSGNITMEDVDFPVFGMDNLGNMAAMMPGANYKFPGDMVFEMPMAQRGLEKYQTKGELTDYGFGAFGEVLPNEVLTMANAPAFFNNQAVYYRDDSVPVETEQRYNDMIREKIYAGTHGYNPATKQLVVLDEAADVNSLDQLYSSLDRDEMPGSVSSGIASKDREAYMDTLPADQREALEDEYKDMRKGFVMRSNEAAFKNPIMYAPGLAYTMGVLGPAYGPAISSTAGTYSSAPLTVGSYVNPYITAGNLLNAGFAADFLVNRAPKIPGLMQEGNYGEAALDGGLGALDLAGAYTLPIRAGSALGRLFRRGKSLIKPNKSFKSEIDWGKWNEEIPLNKELMQEYHTIEEVAKAKGTWMKNPDGSPFEGLPEQWVQQNSANYQKAFPNALRNEAGNIQISYHGSLNKFDEFDESKFMSGVYGKGVYTSPDKQRVLNSYANPDRRMASVKVMPGQEGNSNLYELYINTKNPGNFDIIREDDFIDDIRFYGFKADDFPTLAEWKKSDLGKKILENNSYLKTDQDILDFLNRQSMSTRGGFVTPMNVKENFRPVLPDYDFIKVPSSGYQEQVTPFSNRLKSAVGNNGMFDMTNPNMYKQRGGGLPIAQRGNVETIPTSGIKPITYYDMLNAAYPGQYEFTTNTERYYGDEPTINPRTQTITSNQIPLQYDYVVPMSTAYVDDGFFIPPMKGTGYDIKHEQFIDKVYNERNSSTMLEEDVRPIVDKFLKENIQDIIENPSEYYLTEEEPPALDPRLGTPVMDISSFYKTKSGIPEATRLYLKGDEDDYYVELSGDQAYNPKKWDYDRLFDLTPAGSISGRLFELGYRPGYTQHDVTTTEARLKPPVFTKQEEFEFDRDKFLEDMAERDERQRMLSQNFLIDYLEKEPSRAGKTYYYYDDDEGNILYATGQPRFGTQGNQTGEEQEYLRQFEQFTNKDGTLKTPKVISLKDNPKKFKEIEDKIYHFAYENINGATPTFQGQSYPGGGILRSDLINPQENNMIIKEKGGELEQRAIAMGESPEYATAVQRMIDNGATIQELASRRIGTVSGLSQLFPDAEMGSVSQRSSSSGSAATSEIEVKASEFGMTPEDYNRYYNRGLRFISEGKTIDDLVNMRYGTRSGLTRMFPDAPIRSSATYSPSPENKPSPMPQQTPAQVSSVPTEIPAQPAMIVPDPIIAPKKDVDAGLAADAQMAREQMYTTPTSQPINISRKDVDAGLASDAQMAREQMRSGSLNTQPNIILESYLPETIIYGEKEEPLGYNSINIPSLSGQFNFSSGLSKFLPIPAASTEPYFTVPEGTFRGPSTIEEIRQQNAVIQEKGKAILQDRYVSSGVNKYTNIPFDEYPLYLAEDIEGYDQVINEANQDVSQSTNTNSPYADEITETEINRRLVYDIPRYGEFMNNPRVVNRTGNLRQNDANIFFADVAKPNSVIIDIGAGLGNSNPREAGISTYELFKNPKIQENNITVIASDIAPEAKKFIGRENNPHGDMEAYSIPINEQDWSDINNYMTPIADILKEKGVSDTEDVYLRATNGIDILMDEAVTEKHFEHLGNTLTDKNITYVFNNVILYKPKGEKQFVKIGNVANTGMDHRNPSWIGKDFDPTRSSHYLLNDDLFGDGYVPRRRFGGGLPMAQRGLEKYQVKGELTDYFINNGFGATEGIIDNTNVVLPSFDLDGSYQGQQSVNTNTPSAFSYTTPYSGISTGFVDPIEEARIRAQENYENQQARISGFKNAFDYQAAIDREDAFPADNLNFVSPQFGLDGDYLGMGSSSSNYMLPRFRNMYTPKNDGFAGFEYLPYLGDAIDAGLFLDAVYNRNWSDAGIYGAGLLLPFVPGSKLKKFFRRNKSSNKPLSVDDIPMDDVLARYNREVVDAGNNLKIDINTEQAIPVDADYFRHGFLKGRGPAVTRDDLLRSSQYLKDQGLTNNPLIYYHGAGSSSIPGVNNIGGLVPAGRLLDMGYAPNTIEGGMLMYRNQVNDKALSVAKPRYSGLATDYALGRTRINPDRFARQYDNFLKNNRLGYSTDPNFADMNWGSGMIIPYDDYVKKADDLYSQRIRNFENASPIEQQLITENFPVLYGINPRSTSFGEGRYIIPNSDLMGEGAIIGGVSTAEIPTVFVPNSRMGVTSEFLPNTDVRSLEDFISTSPQYTSMFQETYPNAFRWQMLQAQEKLNELKNLNLKKYGGGIDDDGKIKYVAETDQGGYRVGVDVDRGDRQRSRSFSLEPSGDTSYSRSVTTPKGSRSKSIDIVDGEATKTITRTRNGETIERTKTLSDRKADRLSKRYARKVNSVFTDPFPEVPNPNEGKFTIEYEQGGEAVAPDFGSYGLNIEDTLLFPRYINYMNGNDESIEARRVYDKLNRKVYRYAKQGGMTAPDYMMTEVLRLGGSV